MNSTAAAVDRNQTVFLDWRRRQRIVTCRGALTSPGHNGDSIRLVRIHQIDQYADFFDLDDNVKSDTVLHGGRNSLNHAGSLHQANQWKERRPLQTKSPHDGQKREERMKTKTWRDNTNGAGFSAMKKILRSSAFAVAVFATSAVLATEARAQSCVDPEALTFAMVPTEETVAELQLYKPITDRLAQETGKKVQFFMPTSYASVVEGLVGKFVNVAVLGPASYVTANKLDPQIEVFATYAKTAGIFQVEGPGYQAVLVSKAGSKFDSIDSLKGALIGLTDPGSTSGELLPRVVFPRAIGGVDIEKYFGKTVYTGSHELSAVAVVQGKVDAAFIATHRLDNAIAKGDVKAEDFHVIWTSAFVPQDPFVYRGDLCPELKEKIRSTFLGLSPSVPEEKAFLDNVKSEKFVAMTSADYDLIRDLQAAKSN